MQPNPESLVNMTTNSTRNTPFTTTAFYPQDSRVGPADSTHSFDVAVGMPSKEQRKQLDEAVAKAKMSKEAVKFDTGKVDWTLVPFEALEGMAEVLAFGAKKYDSWNWTTAGGLKWTRVLASTMRHLFAFMRGEDVDPESGLSHISHAQCNLLFLAYYIRNKKQFPHDDRYVR